MKYFRISTYDICAFLNECFVGVTMDQMEWNENGEDKLAWNFRTNDESVEVKKSEHFDD